MKLCMAKATKDGTGKEVYNVIAKTSGKHCTNFISFLLSPQIADESLH